MCGIFGSIKLNSSINENRTIVAEGIHLLSHRGPDENGIETFGAVCFGHARLSIIDLIGGRQPMMTNDRKGLITYNGEVYNYRDIRRELERSGRVFTTNSDTEVVLNAYLEWGADCLHKFRGMFAFVCADFVRERIILARDRVGKKPLYYTVQDETLFFSSELEPLYQTIGPFKIDLEALDEYLYWQYIPSPKTIYKDVISLPPGHLLEVNLKTPKIEPRRYWNLQFKQDSSLTFEDWEIKLDEIIREAVKIRLVSDVPFGAFLSGGIDSSLVVGYMAELLEIPVKTFSIGFKNADYTELKYADRVATICKTDHYHHIVEADSLKILPLLVKHYGQPFADSSAIPTYYVSRMARPKVKMVLSGDGGDENFAGYNTYENILNQLNGFDAAGTCQAKRLYRLTTYWYRKLKGWVCQKTLSDSIYEMHCALYRHFSPSERRDLYKDRFRNLVSDKSSSRRTFLNVVKEPILSRIQFLDIMTYLPYDILTKVDIASMANSLEVRTPLLDHKLMEAVATMPAEFKLKGEKIDGKIRYDKKHVLKRLAYKRYPTDVIDRPKKGFGIPLGEWFLKDLKEEIEKRLLRSECLPLIFNMAEIENLVNAHSPRRDVSHKLWNLLFLDEWMRTHKDALWID